MEPNGTNAVPSTVRAWLDARAIDESALNELVNNISDAARSAATTGGTAVEITTESFTGVLEFDSALRSAVSAAIAGGLGLADVPVLPTAAGHDAGILASAGVPTAMIFVRNPTGVSHSPYEHADESDCEVGVGALAAAVTGLLS